MSVTPTAGLISNIVTGGIAVNAIGALPNGGFITNPVDAADQGLAVAEVLYVDPVGAAGLAANGTTFALYPGQSWPIIPGQTTPTSVNAASSGHKFSVVSW
jgi:hypothetical protein